MRTIKFIMCILVGVMMVLGNDSCNNKKKVHDDSSAESLDSTEEKSEESSGEKSVSASKEETDEKDFDQERLKNENKITANEKKMLIIDFYATWCGPCKAMAPVMDKMEGKYGDKFEFTRIDVDREQELAAQYNIEAIPTLVILSPSNEVIARIEGFKNVDEMDEILSKL